MFAFTLEKPTSTEAFKEGLLWDLIIIGGGPAGLNAALYAKRKGLSVGILSKDLGGQLHNTSFVDNYLGFTMIEGKNLSDAFINHVTALEVPIYKDVDVMAIEPKNPNFEIHLANGQKILAKTVLLATGGSPKKLDIPGEKIYSNRGVSYCTTCDAPFFKDKHVVVAGGGNSAAEAVLDLSTWAKKITVVHRSQWRADAILLEKLAAIPHLDVRLETRILEVIGDDKMTGLMTYNNQTKHQEMIEADGLFVEIGTTPKSHLFQHLVRLNDRYEVMVDPNQMTSYPGMFAAGDVTDQPYKQIIISAAEGAKAALSISHYLNHTYKGALS